MEHVWKVGDRVRALCGVGDYIRSGDVGTVAAIDCGGCLWCTWDNPVTPELDEFGWCIRADEVAPADAAIASLSAPQPPAEAQPVAWSEDKPGRPGVYGVRGFNLCRGPEEQFEAVVSVRLYEGDLICNLHECTSEEDFDRWIRVEDCSDGFEWCEFVPAHPPPSAPVGADVGDKDCLTTRARELLADEYRKRGIGTDLVNDAGTATSVALAAIATALAQQPAAFRNDGNSEAEFIADDAIACTACGGSGHRDDQQPAAVDDAIRRDADRYRWLRLHANTEWEAETVLHVVQAGGRTLDLRIDEALAAQQGDEA